MPRYSKRAAGPCVVTLSPPRGANAFDTSRSPTTATRRGRLRTTARGGCCGDRLHWCDRYGQLFGCLFSHKEKAIAGRHGAARRST